MLTSFALAAIILLLVASTSAILLVRDAHTSHLQARVDSVHSHTKKRAPAAPVQRFGILSTDQRSGRTARLMHLLRFNPDNAQQNVIAWKLVIAIACAVALAGFFYGRAFIGWPLAALVMPIEALLVARVIFGWERARYQNAVLEQLPEVMALICSTVGAGIPLNEALRSVALDAPSPSREAFVRVVNDVAIGQPLEGALWKLHERVGLAEYAFFAVTIGLQAQTGGSLVETLENLQDVVRRRVGLSKRGMALAAESRMSAKILGGLPFLAAIMLAFLRPDFIDFFLTTPSGNHLLLAAFGLLGMGILVMRQMIRRSLAP